MHIQLGEDALDGKEEYIPSHIFEAANHDRWISGRGTLILIFDPRATDNTPPYWKHNSTTQDSRSQVPAGYEVKVIDGRVKMTK